MTRGRALPSPLSPPPSHPRRHDGTALRRAATALAAGALALAGAVALPAAPAQADTTAKNDVIANLWEWNWDSVASECTNVLGPAGYGAVQVAPPAESLKQTNYYWWDVYQPYSYNLNSRFGSAAKFASMVSTCHAAGVKVYTDAVINHTAAQTGTGYNGTTLTSKYDTPEWDRSDYHDSSSCPTSDLTIQDYSNLNQVQNCELLGLPDLKTGADSVRSGIANFLNSQLALGVDGFRVDAAKHIPETDLAAIESKLTKTTSGSAPYVFQEVYPGSTPQPSDYYASGDVLDFTYASKLKSAFQGNVSDLSSIESSGILPAANSVSFVTNHDTERNGLHMSYKDGDSYKLANLFQLAYKWSTPTVYASWEWTQSDQAPPNSSGFVTNTDCSNGWYCLDRDTAVVGMVAWHNAAEALKKRDPGITVIETYNAYDATRAEPVIRQMLDSGAGVLSLSTFVLTDIAKTVAKEFPKVPMVLTSFGVTQSPNLSSGTASYLEIGYSACWLLEKISKSGEVGYIGAQKAPFEAEVLTGCKLGAAAANPKAQVIEGYTNSFTDTQANHEQVKKLLDQGITEIMLGSSTEDLVGGLRLCETSGAHCATWGGDARRWAPKGCVLTVVLNWDVVMEDLVKQARTGEVGPPKSWDLTFGNGGLSVADYTQADAVSPALQAEFKTVVADLASGKTKLPESKAHPGAR